MAGLVAVGTHCNSIFYLSIFKLLEAMGKRLEGLMRRFLWEGSEIRQSPGLAMDSWDVVCRPTKVGGLGMVNA